MWLRMLSIWCFCVLLVIAISAQAEIKVKKLLKTKWRDVSSENFKVITDASEKTAVSMVKNMEKFRQFIGVVLQEEMLPGVKPFYVLAPSKTSTFKSLDLPDTWGGVYRWDIDGFVSISNITGYNNKVSQSSWGNHTLMHEYVHYAMRNLNTTKFYPPWYSEGVAEYIATFRYSSRKNTVSIGNLKQIGWRFLRLRNNASTKYLPIDIEDLFKTRDLKISWRGEKEDKNVRREKKDFGKFYARSVAVVHYLNSSKERKKQLSKYVELINQGRSIDYAFERTFSMSYEELDELVIDYISGRTMKGWVYDLGEQQFAVVDPKVVDLPKEEAFKNVGLTLGLFSVYKQEERNNLIDKIKELNVNSMDVAEFEQKKELGRLLHASSSERDSAFANLNLVLKEYPDSSILNAMVAEYYYATAKDYYNLGLDGSSYLSKARKSARKVLSKDVYNSRAYRVLGRSALIDSSLSNKYIEEGRVSFESRRLLAGINSRSLYGEFMLNLRMGKLDGAAQSLLQYLSISNGRWSKGYGRFLAEALEVEGQFNRGIEKVTGTTILYSNGALYSGGIENGIPHGEGKLELPEGGYLLARWDKGDVDGAVEFYSSNGFHYVGTAKDSIFSGFSTLTYPNGSDVVRSEGWFKYGIEHGEQSFFYKNGAVERGEFIYGGSDGVFDISQHNGENVKLKKVHWRYIVEYEAGKIYSGDVDESYRPNGKGVCFSEALNKPLHCKATNGKVRVFM